MTWYVSLILLVWDFSLYLIVLVMFFIFVFMILADNTLGLLVIQLTRNCVFLHFSTPSFPLPLPIPTQGTICSARNPASRIVWVKNKLLQEYTSITKSSMSSYIIYTTPHTYYTTQMSIRQIKRHRTNINNVNL